MSIVSGSYPVAEGTVLLDVIVGDTGIGSAHASIIDPTVTPHTATPIPLPTPPSGVPLGGGPALAHKVLLVTVVVKPRPGVNWTSATMALSGGGAPSHWSLSAPATSGELGTFTFLIGMV